MLRHSARCKKCGKQKTNQQILEYLRREMIIGDHRLVSVDLDSGCGDDVLSSVNHAPLIDAAKRGSVTTLLTLLDRGVDVNEEVALTKSTALIEATRFGQHRIVRLLIDRGAKLDHADVDGLTALHVAAEIGSAPIVKLLIARGASVDLKNRDGCTALFQACAGGHTEVARVLLQAGALVNARDKYGAIPLIFAVSNGHFDVAKLLLQNGACVNHINSSDGLTPLIEACYNGHRNIVRLLLDYGADRSYKTKRSTDHHVIGCGRNALMVAAERGHYDLMRILMQNPLKSTSNTTVTTVFARSVVSLVMKFVMLAFFDYNL